jgi:hypothetical protein
MVCLTFSTPHGERSLIAKSGSPAHIRAALRMVGADWLLIALAEA